VPESPWEIQIVNTFKSHELSGVPSFSQKTTKFSRTLVIGLL
jgi:hypothetical protein